ncbi:MAG: CBS domain-containing protein [Minicystis sp.]
MDAPGKTMRVRDIMTTEVITLAASTKADDAARSLTFHRVSGAPVLDHGRIVGVVSKSDLVDPRNRPTGDERPTVGEVMTPLVFAVRPGDPAMSAVRLMVEESVHRAVVVDDHGRLKGIVSPMDVLRALGRGDYLQRNDPVHQDRLERHADPATAQEEPDLPPPPHVGFVDLRMFELDG